jgi:predicted nucleic acid-binding protein
MILVDTSVLIDFLKDIKNPATDKFTEIIDLNIPFGITSHIYQELLQGASSQKDFDVLKKYLDTFTFFSPLDKKDSYAQAANIYFHCRKKGITVRSSVDCIIAQIVLEQDLKLLHNDKDFENIKQAVTSLEFY